MSNNFSEVFLITYFKTREISEDYLRSLVKQNIISQSINTI